LEVGWFAKPCWPVLYLTPGLKVNRQRDEANMTALIADLLTLSRVVAAGILLWLGMTGGASALPAATLVVVLGWTTDQLDGWLARSSSTPTRLKDYDFQVDVLFYAGILGYLAVARFLPVWLVAGFVIMSVVAWLVTRRKAVAILCLRIVDVTCGVIVFAYAPVIGLVLVAWLAAVAVAYRRRLAERVPRWFDDLRGLWRGRVG
jgi:phosphatidylglycerophosphate synthase